MIHLITGLPGGGKTATMVELIVAANKEQSEREQAGEHPRPIYACGIDGLADGLAIIMTDAAEWQSCPDGALIFVDEAWKWFGHLSNAQRAQTPPHVLALAEHRHRGIDFVWTAQGPNQIYPFARPLISPHWHVVRRFNTSVLDVYKWEESTDEVKSQAMRDRATKTIRTLPKATFGLYKSASLHTMKSRIPLRVFLAIAAVVLLGLPLAWWGISRITPEAQAARLAELSPGGSAAGDTDTATGGEAGGTRTAKRVMTAREYASQLRPRIPGMHGSQPIFGEREAQAVPRTFCVISGEGIESRCSCYTEQVTPIADVREDVCRTLARHGAYDPFRAPPESRRSFSDAGSRGVGAGAPTGTRHQGGIRTDPASVGGQGMGEVW